jgi:large subunit ribosomal protein L23
MRRRQTGQSEGPPSAEPHSALWAATISDLEHHDQRRVDIVMSATAIAKGLAPRLGQKNVYLPWVSIKLVHRRNLPPTTAVFEVPLNFNKLDLRSYLYNAYGLATHGIRSFIHPGSAGTGHRGQMYKTEPKPRKKLMFVDFDRPFTWPEVPTDLKPWDKELFDIIQDVNKPPDPRKMKTGPNDQLMNFGPMVEPNVKDAFARQKEEILAKGWKLQDGGEADGLIEVVEQYKKIVKHPWQRGPEEEAKEVAREDDGWEEIEDAGKSNKR